MTFTPNVLNTIDPQNSTTTLLGANSGYFGTFSNTTGYNSVQISIRDSVNSAPCGLKVYASQDGITGPAIFSDTYYGGTNYEKIINLPSLYYKTEYTNGPTGQIGTFFLASRLSTDLNNNSQNAPPNLYSYTNDPQLDAFGKLRVTNPLTLVDLKFPGQTGGSTGFLSSSETICTRITNGIGPAGATGTLTYGNSELQVIGWTGGTFVSQSRKYCTYQPGKSLLFLASGNLNPDGNNPITATTSIGYFDDINGVYFSYSHNSSSFSASINLRSNGFLVQRLFQTDWNIDKMDGTGQSGLTLDFTKAQLFVIDLEWLSVGRVRFGFYAYGRIFYCHQIINFNGNTGPYMISPNLPIRYEIVNDSASPAALTQICSTVISEGGYSPEGRPFSVSNGAVGVNVTTSETAVLAIRGGHTGYYHQNIIPNLATYFSSSSTAYSVYRIYLIQSNSSGVIGTWLPADQNYSIVQYMLPTSFTPGILVQSGYFISKSDVSINSLTNAFSNFVQLTSDANNVADILLLTAQRVDAGGGPNSIYASIDWQEVY